VKEREKMAIKLLVVDDQLENRMILEGILEDLYLIETAEDGEEAATILKNSSKKPLLVLSDIEMPLMNGYELMAIIKEDPDLRHIPVIFITSSQSEVEGLDAGAIDFITKPFSPEIVRLRVNNQVELARYRAELEELVEEKAGELIQTKETFVETMAAMIEYRSLESGEHIKRTKNLTEILVNQLLETETYGSQLRVLNPNTIVKASPLHDVGKIGIPDNILLKPGKLTQEEFKIIETHAIIGSEMITTMMTDKHDDYLQHCHDIARHHHERWDGQGYPDKLAGEAIPLSARIVALVDVYDALISERCYKKGMTHEQAMNIITNESGTHFDAEVVNAMIEAQDKIQE